LKPTFAPLSLLFALSAGTSAQAADTYGHFGIQLTVTPGHKFPLGPGLWADVGAVSHPGALTGYIQVEARGVTAPRLGLGVRTLIGGFEPDSARIGATVGAGWVARAEGGNGLSFELGAQNSFYATAAHARFETTWAFDPSRGGELGPWEGERIQETSLILAGGVGSGPYGGLSVSIAGRPIRHDGKIALPRSVARGRMGMASREWLERARTEHASVPAFRQLAAELSALGAPRRLIGRTLGAAEDERRHALLCYGMVERLTGAPVTIGTTPAWSVRGGDRAARLSRIARESLHDGIIGEGQAADDARARRDASSDELVARVEHAIVVEESAHASLAQDVLLWARREGATTLPV